MTRILNKHLFPVYDRPMIYYPLQTLVKAGIEEIMLVAGGERAGGFLEILGNGKELGIKSLHYTFQYEAGGISHALRLAKDFAGRDNIFVILGDNITTDDFSQYVKCFDEQGIGAKVFLKEVPDPHRYGIAEIDGDLVIGLEEKPKNPKTNLCVTGLYMYDSKVWDYIDTIKPSHRGELEITDINKEYMKEQMLEWHVVRGYWTDAGEIDAMLTASIYMAGQSGK
jgi:glucose-1-phosphate thymidylyltransferase